jgi:hypothetical protein
VEGELIELISPAEDKKVKKEKDQPKTRKVKLEKNSKKKEKK